MDDYGVAYGGEYGYVYGVDYGNDVDDYGVDYGVDHGDDDGVDYGAANGNRDTDRHKAGCRGQLLSGHRDETVVAEGRHYAVKYPRSAADASSGRKNAAAHSVGKG